MKNKNKTIARNAIRIRNRKRKKEKPNDEVKGIILKRILPFSFALLLVASLFVIPAFATPFEPSDEAYFDLLQSFDNQYKDVYHWAGGLLIPLPSDPISEIKRFFGYDYFYYAPVNVGSSIRPLPPGDVYSEGDAMIQYSTVGTVAVTYGGNLFVIYRDVLLEYSVTYDTVNSNYLLCSLRIDREGGMDRITYIATDGTNLAGTLTLRDYTFNGVTYTPADGGFQIAFLLDSPADNNFLGSLIRLFSGSKSDIALSYPSNYVDSYMNGWGGGYELGYDFGYELGLEKGQESGAGGDFNPDSYNQGYQAAVEDIDSGDFGRNLLGSAFSAPFEALSSFTLVSWDFGGSTITISLMSVLSAVIGFSLLALFLKMFAGG